MNLKTADMLTERVHNFIARSGGIDKCRQLLGLLRNYPHKELPGFLQRVSKSQEGSQQLAACAILGLTLALMLEDAEEQRKLRAGNN